MAETSSPETKDHQVRAHFRKKDPKTGKSVTYDPAGNDGWPGAKDVIALDPTSDEAKELLAGLDHNGPLIFPLPDEPAASKSSTSRSSAASSKES